MAGRVTALDPFSIGWSVKKALKWGVLRISPKFFGNFRKFSKILAFQRRPVWINYYAFTT
jgi:hypothetical protein